MFKKFINSHDAISAIKARRSNILDIALDIFKLEFEAI